MPPTLLVTGASGYVGRAVSRAALAAGYRVIGTYYHARPDEPGVTWLPLDLRNPDAPAALVQAVQPTAIIHTAAAWDTPEAAQATIVAGSAALAGAAAAAGVRLVHISTDMVFDGEHAPYRETDPPAPIAAYGRAKAAAEAAIVSLGGDAVIVRTSLVTCFDPPDPRSAEVLVALRARTQPGVPAPFVLFTDEYRCPVRTEDLAAALVELAGHPYQGYLHVAGPERLSRYELGHRIAAYHGLDPGRLAGGTASASGLARPRDCTLDTSRARAMLHTLLRPLP